MTSSSMRIGVFPAACTMKPVKLIAHGPNGQSFQTQKPREAAKSVAIYLIRRSERSSKSKDISSAMPVGRAALKPSFCKVVIKLPRASLAAISGRQVAAIWLTE